MVSSYSHGRLGADATELMSLATERNGVQHFVLKGICSASICRINKDVNEELNTPMNN